MEELFLELIPVFLIGFNIQECYPLPRNADLNTLQQNHGLKSLCQCIPEEYISGLEVHIQMKEEVLFKSYKDFYITL